MGYDLSCEHTDNVPSELGGGGKSRTEQLQTLTRAEAKRAAPAEFAVLDAYLDSLLRMGRAVEAAPDIPPVSVCKSARGVVPIFGLMTFFDTIVDIPGAPRLHSRETREPSEFQSSFVRAIRSGYGATTAETIALAKLVAQQGQWVAVRRATSVTHPNTSMTPGKSSGTFTPGNWSGALFVVDRISGKLECASPFQTSVTATKVRSNPKLGDPSVSAQLGADFAGGIAESAKATLARIAPNATTMR